MRSSQQIQEAPNEEQTHAVTHATGSQEDNGSSEDEEFMQVHIEDNNGIDIAKKVGLHDNQLLERSFLTSVQSHQDQMQVQKRMI